jgi:uncharacterized membrane protein YeaQ/YmgE (transglycosylase-associated protein family)
VLFALLVLCVVLFVVLPFIGATVMSAIWALLVGLLLGLIGRAIAPGQGRISLTMTALVGVAGGLIGRIVARALNTHSSLGRLLLEVLAAAALVMVFRGSQGART